MAIQLTPRESMTVSQRFDKFLENIRITEEQAADGTVKHGGVRKCLNKHYYDSSSESANSMLVGSWGKHTRVRPPRDIDVLFKLPSSVYQRYETKTGNKQSQLLQEVKNVLANCYTVTKMRGDGQVVIIPFSTQSVELVPAFALNDGKYWVCDTNDGGKYKTFDPDAEIKAIADSDNAYAGNTRHLVRMMKKWQENCNVPLKSFWIELLATDFISSWQYHGKSSVYYDWMVRDFFYYLVNTKANGYVIVPGTYEIIWIGSDWKSRAESAYDRAVKGVAYEAENKDFDAWWEWKNIFGDDVPRD